MSASVVVNNWSTWVAWSRSGRMSDEDIVLTESPGLNEELAGEREVIDISAGTSLIESLELTRRVADLALRWREVLNVELQGLLPGAEPGRIFNRDLANVMVRLAYHRLLLERAASSGKWLLVPYDASVAGNHLSRLGGPFMCPHGVNYFGLAAQAGIPGVEAIAVEQVPADTADGKVATSLRDWFLYPLLKLSSTRPTFAVRSLLRLWERLSRWEAARKLCRRHAFLHTTNGLLLGVVPRLVAGRCSVSRVAAHASVPTANASATVALQAKLLDVTPADLRTALAPAALRVEQLANQVLLPAVEPMREWVRAEVRRCNGDRPAVFLSNSAVNPLEVMMSWCFGEAGVPSVQFQHGGTGLIDRYDKSFFFSDMSVSDGFVCINRHERDLYRGLTADDGVAFHVRGAVREHGAVSARAARVVGRLIWGVKRSEKLVLYAPTRFKEGQVFANDLFDMKYWRWMEALLTHAGATDCRLVVKSHRKGLWSRNSRRLYDLRKDPMELRDRAPNIEHRSYPQLNFARFAADLLIVDRATSTIGWALAADVPLLYLEAPACHLVPEVRAALRDAVFYVDGREDGWTDHVRTILDLPLGELRSRWRSMAPDRAVFIERYALGPTQSRGFWKWLWSVQPTRTVDAHPVQQTSRALAG